MMEYTEISEDVVVTWNDNGDLCLTFDTGAVFTIELPEDEKWQLPPSMDLTGDIFGNTPVIATFTDLRIADLKGE